MVSTRTTSFRIHVLPTQCMLFVTSTIHSDITPNNTNPVSACKIQCTVRGMRWIISVIYFLNKKQRQGGDKIERWEVKKVRCCKVNPLRMCQKKYEHFGWICVWKDALWQNFDNGRLLWAGIFQPVFTKRTSGQCRNFSVSPPSLPHPTFSLQSFIQSIYKQVSQRKHGLPSGPHSLLSH